MQTTNASDRQLEALRLYEALIEVRADWGGGLVLCCGDGCSDSGTPAAVSIAGGATLVLDADAAAVKSAMQRGEIDFVVKTLDEALRALKNQVRLRRPLSVGLIADGSASLCAMVERGVLPDLLLIGAKQDAQAILENKSIHALQAAGMTVRRMDSLGEERGIPPRTILLSEGHSEVYLSAANAVELRAVDERLLAILPLGDTVRRRWIESVAKYLRDARSGGRWMWLSEDELKRLREAGFQD